MWVCEDTWNDNGNSGMCHWIDGLLFGWYSCQGFTMTWMLFPHRSTYCWFCTEQYKVQCTHAHSTHDPILPIFISFDHIWSYLTLVASWIQSESTSHFAAFFRHTYTSHRMFFVFVHLKSQFDPTVSLSLPEFQRQIDKIAKVSSALMENVPSLESFRNLLLGDSKAFIPQSYPPIPSPKLT